MKLKDYKKEDLENMGYDDLAVIVLEDAGKKLKINDIFMKINKVLELSPSEYEDKIGDFFELLSTDKKFIMLDKGYWDLRENHTSEISIKEIEDEMDDEVLPEEEKETTDEEDYYENLDEMDDDQEEDDLKDLVIVDEGYEDDIDM